MSVNKHERCNQLCQVDDIVENISQDWPTSQNPSIGAGSPSLPTFSSVWIFRPAFLLKAWVLYAIFMRALCSHLLRWEMGPGMYLVGVTWEPEYPAFRFHKLKKGFQEWSPCEC